MYCSTDSRISCPCEFKNVEVVDQSVKGFVQKENTEYTEKKCIYFEVGATGLKLISEIRGFIPCTKLVHLKKVADFIQKYYP